MSDDRVTEAIVIASEGARVGIVTCKRCGAAILIDPREEFSAVDRHWSWHAGGGDPEPRFG